MMLKRFDNLFDAFEKAGKKLHLVGGSVRDSILGLEPKDFDFATDARPEETKRILEAGGFKPWPLGEKFGTIAAKAAGEQIEITTYRQDLTPGRHPDVAFTTDLREDLLRRDFTINSMAMDRSGKITDFFGGRFHLEKRLIRCTGSPSARFSEDPLRMLRAARFAAKLGFDIDLETQEAMDSHSVSLLSVSRERWLDEMTKLLTAYDPVTGLEVLRRTRLLWLVIPDMWAVHASPKIFHGPEKDLWFHVMGVVRQTPARPIVRWAALLHDIAKPQTYRHRGPTVHFLQHEVLGAEMVEGICRRLKMSNDMRRAIRGLVFLHQRVAAVFSREGGSYVSARREGRKPGRIIASEKAMRRLVRECDERGCAIEDLMDLFGADCTSGQQRVRDSVAEQKRVGLETLQHMKAEDLRPKLPKGIGEVIMKRLGLGPGPAVGRLRKQLESMLLDGELNPDLAAWDMVDALPPEAISEAKENS
jgi:poly(A) polymerase